MMMERQQCSFRAGFKCESETSVLSPPIPSSTRPTRLSVERGFQSLAFSARSTGVYGSPQEAAAAVVSSALVEHFAMPRHVEQVVLVFFSQAQADTFLAVSPLASTLGHAKAPGAD